MHLFSFSGGANPNRQNICQTSGNKIEPARERFRIDLLNNIALAKLVGFVFEGIPRVIRTILRYRVSKCLQCTRLDPRKFYSIHFIGFENITMYEFYLMFTTFSSHYLQPLYIWFPNVSGTPIVGQLLVIVTLIAQLVNVRSEF